MSAKSINPNQFRLFWSGDELQKAVTYSTDAYDDNDNPEDLPTMWARKEEEARYPHDTVHGGGVYTSMKQSGYRGEPVTIQHVGGESVDGYGHSYEEPQGVETGDGHHRIAAAAALAREGHAGWVHVENYDSNMAARDRAGRRKGPAKG